MSFFQWRDIDLACGSITIETVVFVDYENLTLTTENVSGNIPIHYHCCEIDIEDDGKEFALEYPDAMDFAGAGAFFVGDKVSVLYRKPGFESPVVIGPRPENARRCGFYFKLTTEEDVAIDGDFFVDFEVYDSSGLQIGINSVYLAGDINCWHLFLADPEKQYDVRGYWVFYNYIGPQSESLDGVKTQYPGKTDEDEWFVEEDRITFGYYEDSISGGTAIWLKIYCESYVGGTDSYSLWDVDNEEFVTGIMDLEGDIVPFPCAMSPYQPNGIYNTTFPFPVPWNLVSKPAVGFWGSVWSNIYQIEIIPDIKWTTTYEHDEDISLHAGSFSLSHNKEYNEEAIDDSGFFVGVIPGIGSNKFVGNLWSSVSTSYGGASSWNAGPTGYELDGSFEIGHDFYIEKTKGFKLEALNGSDEIIYFCEKKTDTRYMKFTAEVTCDPPYDPFTDLPTIFTAYYKRSRKIIKYFYHTPGLFTEENIFVEDGEKTLCDQVLERLSPWKFIKNGYEKYHYGKWYYLGTYFNNEIPDEVLIGTGREVWWIFHSCKHPNIEDLRANWDEAYGEGSFGIDETEGGMNTATMFLPHQLSLLCTKCVLDLSLPFDEDTGENTGYRYYYNEGSVLCFPDESVGTTIGYCELIKKQEDIPYIYKNTETLCCPSSSSSSVSSYSFSNDPGSDLSQMVNLHNDHRVSLGLDPLTQNAFMSSLALEHATDMANGTVNYGHSGFSDRASLILTTISRSYTPGENIDMIDNNHEGDKNEFIFQEWLDSPGHRSNIEFEEFNLIGHGFAVSSDGLLRYDVVLFVCLKEESSMSCSSYSSSSYISKTPKITILLSDESKLSLLDSSDREDLNFEVPEEVFEISHDGSDEKISLEDFTPLTPDMFKYPSQSYLDEFIGKIIEFSSLYLQFGGKYRDPEEESNIGKKSYLYHFAIASIYGMGIDSKHPDWENASYEEILEGIKIHAAIVSGESTKNKPTSYKRNDALQSAILETIEKTYSHKRDYLPEITVEPVQPLAFDIYNYIAAYKEKNHFAEDTGPLRNEWLVNFAQQIAQEIYDELFGSSSSSSSSHSSGSYCSSSIESGNSSSSSSTSLGLFDQTIDCSEESQERRNDYIMDNFSDWRYSKILGVKELLVCDGDLKTASEAYSKWVKDDDDKLNIVYGNIGGYACVENIHVMFLAEVLI